MSLCNRLRVELLAAHHDREALDCGEAALDTYLRRLASQDVRRRVAQVFVAVTPEAAASIVGYYTLSALSIEGRDLPEVVARKLPRHPLPAALIGRLAVDRQAQGQSVGRYLLMDALMRVLGAVQSLGIYAVVVDALHDAAAEFYRKYGFQAFPTRPGRLFLPLQTLAKGVGTAKGSR